MLVLLHTEDSGSHFHLGVLTRDEADQEPAPNPLTSSGGVSDVAPRREAENSQAGTRTGPFCE